MAGGSLLLMNEYVGSAIERFPESKSVRILNRKSGQLDNLDEKGVETLRIDSLRVEVMVYAQIPIVGTGGRELGPPWTG